MTELVLARPRVLPPKALLIALAAQLPLIFSSLPLHPTAVEITTGVAFLVAGTLLNVWSERLFRLHDVGVCPFTRVPMIVIRGPYRLTRNPMYVGLVCLNLAATLFSGVLANIWSSVAYALWLHYAFVLPEEAFLRRELGEAFESYARRVPRWLIGNAANLS